MRKFPLDITLHCRITSLALPSSIPTILIMSNHVAQPESSAAANTLVPPTQGEAAGEAFTSKD